MFNDKNGFKNIIKKNHVELKINQNLPRTCHNYTDNKQMNLMTYRKFGIMIYHKSSRFMGNLTCVIKNIMTVLKFKFDLQPEYKPNKIDNQNFHPNKSTTRPQTRKTSRDWELEGNQHQKNSQILFRYKRVSISIFNSRSWHIIALSDRELNRALTPYLRRVINYIFNPSRRL